MSNSNFVYVNPSSTSSKFNSTNSSRTTVTTIEETPTKKFQLKPQTIWIITFIIIAIIIIIAILLAATTKPQTINEVVNPEIVNLGTLIDLSLSPNGCCKPPSTPNTNTQYIYDALSDFTYTFAQTSPGIVCQSLLGPAKDQCLAYVTDQTPGDNFGKGKVLAHLGIKLYYAFSPGQASGVCELYTTCP